MTKEKLEILLFFMEQRAKIEGKEKEFKDFCKALRERGEDICKKS